jgi:hypothetical protein
VWINPAAQAFLMEAKPVQYHVSTKKFLDIAEPFSELSHREPASRNFGL